MGLVVGGVEIDTVPAGGEEYLSSQVAGAVVVGESIGLGVVGTEAGVRDGLLGEGRLVVAAEKGVTGSHAEAFGESEKSFVW